MTFIVVRKRQIRVYRKKSIVMDTSTADRGKMNRAVILESPADWTNSGVQMANVASNPHKSATIKMIAGIIQMNRVAVSSILFFTVLCAASSVDI